MIQLAPSSRRVDEFIEAFEAALEFQTDQDWTSFLPDPSDPDFKAAAVELMRVDLEHHWLDNDQRSLANYRQRLPELFADPEILGQLAYEEYRLRKAQGEAISPDEYAKRYRLDVSSWPRGEDTSLDSGTVTRSLFHPDSSATSRPADSQFPTCGQTIGSFQLVQQIGEGAFAKVFLARQTDLAERHVVLKVTSIPTHESDRLARLQHSHIVPVYSVHRHGAFHVVCMPWLGNTTLADVIVRRQQYSEFPLNDQLFSLAIADAAERTADVSSAARTGIVHAEHGSANKTYVQRCIELALQVAEALHHSHQQQIIHSDIKPANVLLADDGRAMLLDFNTSKDVRSQSLDQIIGGSLPYMAPEHLQAYETGAQITRQCDVYSFGVLLLELLTGRRPQSFTNQWQPTAVPQPASSARNTESQLPADIASIIDKCLSPDVRQRYASMAEVCEDLRRHLTHRPLRHAPNRSWLERCQKWQRRHSRVASLTTLAAVALICASLAIWQTVTHRRHRATAQAQQTLDELQSHVQQLRLTATVPAANSDSSKLKLPTFDKWLVRLHMDDDFASIACDHSNRTTVDPLHEWQALLSADEQTTLRQSAVELAYFAALRHLRIARADHSTASLATAERWNRLAQVLQRDAAESQRQAIAYQANALRSLRAAGNRNDSVTETTDYAIATHLPPQGSASDLLLAVEWIVQGQPHAALEILTRHVDQTPQDVTVKLLLADCLLSVGQAAQALAWYDTCVALQPDNAEIRFHRGVGRLTAKEYSAAIQDFNEALRMQPDHLSALLNRAIAELRQQDYQAAVDDFTESLERGATQSRIFFLRSEAWAGLGDADSARRDYQLGLETTPVDADSCVVRGLAILRRDPDEALSFFQKAVCLDPHSHAAWRNMASVLAEYQRDTQAGVRMLSEMIQRFGQRPDDVMARAVLYARLGNGNAAIADVQQVLSGEANGKNFFQAACVYALLANDTNKYHSHAIQHLGQAFAADLSWLNVAQRDLDLASLRSLDQFQRLLDAAQHLKKATDGAANLNVGDRP
ncbi:MAG: protein kinase [Pirellulaceae bacterium]